MLRHAEVTSPGHPLTRSVDLLYFAPFLLKQPISFQRKATAVGDDGNSDQI